MVSELVEIYGVSCKCGEVFGNLDLLERHVVNEHRWKKQIVLTAE